MKQGTKLGGVEFVYDPQADVVEIGGFSYAMDVFKMLGALAPTGVPFEIVERKSDGVIVMRTVDIERLIMTKIGDMSTDDRSIYVAGPYTKGSVELNVFKAITAGNVLKDLGFRPFVPHLYHFWDKHFPLAYDEVMEIDEFWLDRCARVYRIEGESSGADREVARAVSQGKIIFNDIIAAGDFALARGWRPGKGATP